MRLTWVLCAATISAVITPSQLKASGALDHWYGGEYQSCDGSTVDVIECVNSLHDSWDARLNVAYRNVIDAESATRGMELRDVQRSWIAYRDANCSYYAGGEGSIARIEAAVCHYVLTRDRAQELEMMLGQ